MSVVEVVTGARLHFGLICGEPLSANRFGGIGLMLRQPCWRVSAERSETLSCSATSIDVRQRIEQTLPAISRNTGLSGLRIAVDEELSFHRGLGAGTQLLLAVATAAGIVAGQPRPIDSRNLAHELNRSRRSAVGTFGFDRGGLIIDGGQTVDGPDRQLQKHELPESWRVVLISPVGDAGLSGTAEESVFQEESWMSGSIVERQVELLHGSILPAVQKGDFAGFREALGTYGRNAGSFFALQQGGIYSSAVVRQMSEMQELKDLQPVQSSWGPTVAVFAKSVQHAEEIVERIQQTTVAPQLTCQITEPLNCGATVRTIAPEASDQVVRG
jgi:beta-ribofuranosylaminobenzene 5'-phosphate synthase